MTPALLIPSLASAEDPPAGGEAVGGAELAGSGTAVRLADGAPELPDELTAKSWIVADAETGEVFAAHAAHRRLPPASTIKMLFADTVLPKLDREATYRAEPEHFTELGAGSSAVGVADGHTYTVEDLWRGVFLASGNDAVYALTAMNGGKEATVAEMNERAADLQALDTQVVNPDGYDADGQLSSAYDLTLFARAGLQHEDFREYAATASADFPGEGEGEDRETYEIQNTNRLLVGAPGLDPYPGIAGVKNGYTSEAGYTFTGVAERDDRVLLVTVMDPSDDDNLAVYREAAALLDWGFAAADLVEPVGELVRPLSESPPEDAEGDDADSAGSAGSDGSDGKNADEAAQAGAAGAAGDADSASGPLVLTITAGGLAVLAVAAYVFHRRHPLPVSLPTRRRRDGPAD
ncbi:D-alanyl-D-alanine carboxypeptidase [Streptomyces sp. 3MP-14]|uniref:D-alanyl-D-alanine carboxypeptidase n=1 Tax=Streptomyces mimosae TaxID=2586635 RepID=A0A5N6AAS8_9ACTN|nr:D-alanyl-D-alanine carboxypeptidase [Streptomyces mimosae]KAB8175998.1 D-alanyl-D-alanine carboxypeptidase [Streptomyces sp. 3MP-14]